MGKRHRNSGFRFENAWILGIIIGIGILLFISNWFLPPLIGSIIKCILIDGIIIWLTFSKLMVDEHTLLEKITMILYGFIYTLFSFLNATKVAIVIYIVYAFFNVAVAIFGYYRKKEAVHCVYIFGCLAVIAPLTITSRIKSVDSSFSFWEPSLIFAILAFLVSIIVVIKLYFPKTGKEKPFLGGDRQNIIWIPLAGLMFGFFIPWLCINSFNYAFDVSEPVNQTYTIVEKDIEGGSRSLTHYDLSLKNDEREIEISVSRSAYEEYEIGDEIVISLYQGAFNVPYYVYEE